MACGYVRSCRWNFGWALGCGSTCTQAGIICFMPLVACLIEHSSCWDHLFVLCVCGFLDTKEKTCSESYATMGKYSIQCAFNGAQCTSPGPKCIPTNCKADIATVSPSKFFTGTRELMANNLKVWGDRNYGLGWSGGGLLQGATFYRLSYVAQHWKGVTLTLNGVQDATVILCPLVVSAAFLQSLHVFACLCYVFTIWSY